MDKPVLNMEFVMSFKDKVYMPPFTVIMAQVSLQFRSNALLLPRLKSKWRASFFSWNDPSSYIKRHTYDTAQHFLEILNN